MSKISPEPDASTIDCLDAADWSSVLPAVLKYAEAQAKKFQWLGDEVNPEALAQEAILRAYRGDRKWDRHKCPQLKDFLIGIIRSMTSHIANHENKFPKESLCHDNGDLKNFEIYQNIDRLNNEVAPKTPEEELLEAENLKNFASVLNEIISSKDEKMALIVLCLEDGIGKPQKIAEETGLEIKKVYSLLKKIRNKIDSYNPKNKGTRNERQ